MKKLLMIGVFFVGALCLAGCGSKSSSGSSKSFSCKVSYDGDKQELKVYLDSKNKVKAIDLYETFDDADTAEEAYEYYKEYLEGATVTVKGKTITIKDAHKIEDSNFVNVVGKDKKEAKEYILELEPDATCD